MPAEAILYRMFFKKELELMLAGQCKGLELYAQPNGKGPNKRLREANPTLARPLTIYFSTGDAPSVVSYMADLVAWIDKRELNSGEKKRIGAEIAGVGFNEGLFGIADNMVNLLQFRKLQKLGSPFSVGELIKVDDGKPHSTEVFRAGISYVYEREV